MTQRDNSACLESLELFLQHVLQGPIMEGLISIREQGIEIATRNSGGEMDDVAVTKQLLKEVKNWTQVLLDEEVRRLLQTIPFLQKLLTALFVMKVKVLSVINMRKDSAEFPLTIPANATFVHHVYIQCANVLLDNPAVIKDMSIVDLSRVVQEGIRKACFACIEWSDLLAWGLDGVDVNDVIKNVMEENHYETKERSVDDNEKLAPSFAEAEDEDFHDMANEVKMADEPNHDNDRDGSRGERDEESLFDYNDSGNAGDQIENQNDESADSVEGSSESSAEDATSQEGDSEEISQSSKIVSSQNDSSSQSDPSFF